MINLFDGGFKGITVDGKSLLFELLSLLLEHRLSRVVFCEELDDFWRTEDIWVGLMTESFNWVGTDITCDGNLLIFELMPLLLNHRLWIGVFHEELDDFWQNEDSWYGLMT